MEHFLSTNEDHGTWLKALGKKHADLLSWFGKQPLCATDKEFELQKTINWTLLYFLKWFKKKKADIRTNGKYLRSWVRLCQNLNLNKLSKKCYVSWQELLAIKISGRSEMLFWQSMTVLGSELCCNLPAFVFIPAGNTWTKKRREEIWLFVQHMIIFWSFF